MFRRAFLQLMPNNKLGLEESLVQEECVRKGIPVVPFHPKKMQRRQLALIPSDFVAGTLDVVNSALKQMQVPVPVVNDYPECLKGFLVRRVWSSTVGGLERLLCEISGEPFFAKPADKRKSFTGGVISTSYDFQRLNHISKQDRVWCSEVVDWVSEYRAYVLGTKILSLDWYGGDRNVSVCMDTVQSAVEAYRASGGAPIAYAIDFGKLRTGQTALIEVNDGYSVGAYQIGAQAYTDFLFARWSELMHLAPSAPLQAEKEDGP